MHVVLREASYVTRLAAIDRSSVVCFEDETLTGFGHVFDDPHGLLANWKAMETAILRRFAPNLRGAGDKAWNVYCLFLCGVGGDPIQERLISWIEEDLDRTRKIAACGITTREDVIRAMLPILPLQNQPELKVEDVGLRLDKRIRAIAPGAYDVVLDESVPLEDVVRLLGESA